VVKAAILHLLNLLCAPDHLYQGLDPQDCCHFRDTTGTIIFGPGLKHAWPRPRAGLDIVDKLLSF